MFADTNSMRKLLEAAEGNLVVMVKADVAALLKLLDNGQAAERKLAAIGGVIMAPAVVA